MNDLNMNTWTADWLWSLPLVGLTVMLHTFALRLMHGGVTRVLNRIGRPDFVSVPLMGVTVLLATILHGTEGMIWAGAFRLLGALPDTKVAMLPSRDCAARYRRLRNFDSVAAKLGAPFAGLASASPTNRAEQLAALGASFSDPDATLPQELLTLLSGELHRAHPSGGFWLRLGSVFCRTFPYFAGTGDGSSLL